MSRIIWDGEKIVVDSSRLNVEHLDSLCDKYNGQRLPLSPFYEFPRNMKLVKELGSLDRIVMDSSFQKLYDAVIRSENKKVEILNEKINQYEIPETLYPFQKEAVINMIESERNILLASEPGTGKSCMASVFLSRKENSYPALIVCPASLKVNWEVEINKWTPGLKTYIISGRDSYADSRIVAKVKKADVIIINYDILGIDDKEAVRKEKERIAKAKEEGRPYRKAFIPVKGWAVEFSKNFDFKSIVCDECFIAGTKINTLFGLKNIEDVKIGEFVLSCNVNGILEYKKVIGFSKKEKECNYAYVSNDLGYSVICTDNHKFFTDYNKFQDIASLHNEDLTLSLVQESQKENIYDFKSDDFRNYVRRWLFNISRQSIEKSKNGSFSFSEKFRLCYEEIRNTERLLQSTTKNSKKRWMGWQFVSIYNEMLCRYEDILRFILCEWKEINKKGNSRFIRRRISSLLVHGRWKFFRYAAHLYLCFFFRRTLHFTKMAFRKISNSIRHSERQTEKCIFSLNKKRMEKSIFSHDRTVCNRIYEIQNKIFRYSKEMLCLWRDVYTLSQSFNTFMFGEMQDYLQKKSGPSALFKSKISKTISFEKRIVYDITVEDNHNFFANGFLVHNCQYIESTKAIRSRAVIQISADSRIKKVFLSGTPFETKVKQFYNACHILAPDLFPKESDFLFRYCNPKHGYFGWTFDGVSNLEELRRKLSLFMIRHRKEDVLKQLPPKQSIPVYLDMAPNVREDYDNMEEELLKQKEGMHQFSYLAEMKKVLVDIKKDTAIQYIKDMLEIEEKIVVMVHHNEMYEYLMEKFDDIAVGFNGGVAAFKRQDAVNKFQKNKKVRLFIGQINAAGTGITLTASHTLIFVEWGNTSASMMQAQDRIQRIGQENHCQIYYLIVKDTIDEGPLGNLSNHYGDIRSVLDGETNAKFVDIDQAMIANVKERVLMRRKKGLRISYQN